MEIVQIYFKHLNKLAIITNFLEFFFHLFGSRIQEGKLMRIRIHRHAWTFVLKTIVLKITFS